MPPLEVPRSYLGLACCHGQIYAYGGYSGGWGLQGHLTVNRSAEDHRLCRQSLTMPCCSVERFDPLASTWETVSLHARHSLICRLTTTMAQAPSLSNQRARFGSVALGDYIYAIGGVNAFERPLNSVERLDVTDPSAAWQSIAPLPRPVCDVATAVVNTNIYVCGGRRSLATQSEVVASLLEYSSDTGRFWLIGSCSGG